MISCFVRYPDFIAFVDVSMKLSGPISNALSILLTHPPSDPRKAAMNGFDAETFFPLAPAFFIYFGFLIRFFFGVFLVKLSQKPRVQSFML